MRLLGIDPGKKGGLAVMKNGKIEDVMGMVVGGKDLDLEYIASWIVDAGPIDLAMIEKVHAFPIERKLKGGKTQKQGIVSMFTFGKVTGAIYGILATLKIPYRLVPPGTWKKLVLAGTDRTKEAALDHVKILYPYVELKGTPQSRKPHNGIVDAICLAEYGWLTFGRKNNV